MVSFYIIASKIRDHIKVNWKVPWTLKEKGSIAYQSKLHEKRENNIKNGYSETKFQVL